MRDTSYAAVLSRKNEIMKASLGIDYDTFVSSPVAFDYERMMAETGYSLDDIARIQAETKVGNTPLHELTRLTEAVRATAAPGKGARILVKDEAANASGSFKARRASISAYEAKRRGYAGVIAATSGNYGAGVASQAERATTGPISAAISSTARSSVARRSPRLAPSATTARAVGAAFIGWA